MPRGGKRSGSGRKAVKLSGSGKLKRVDAEEILAAQDDEKESWLALLGATTTVSVAVIYPDGKEEGQPTRELITVPDNKIRLEARKYLTDKRDGKAPQAVVHKGDEDSPIKIVFKRDPETPPVSLPATPI